jgi:hypothetical protein
MNRQILPIAACLALAVVPAAFAQSGPDSMKNHNLKPDTIAREVQHWHFDGTVESVNRPGRQILIRADSIPLQYGGKTTLPYDAPPSLNLDNIHHGDVVNADLVVRDKRTRVENFEMGPTKHAARKTTRKPAGKKT